MSTLPSASTRVSTQSGTAPVATDLIAVFAPVTTLADGVPRLYSSTEALVSAHGYSEGAEYAALHMQDTGKAVLLVPLPIGTAGVVKRQKSMHTGTSAVTAAVGSDGALAEVKGILKVVTGGTVGTDQIRLSLSLDDGTSYKPVRLGTASSYTVPNIGITISFGAGTLVADDTVLEFDTSAPVFDSTGVTTGKTGMIAQQLGVRDWLFVGDVSTLALGQAIETAVNAYDTAASRYVRAKFQARDRKVLKSSQQRAALVGSTQLTFAEVGATGDTITRATGSFVTDGFQVGDYIRVTGSASNNVSGKITGVTATVLTLDTTDLAAEVLASGGHITAEPAFTFAATTITRNRGSWTAEGFAIGDTITIAGSTSNDGTAVITNISATVITCSASTFTVGVDGSCSMTVSLTESKAAHVAANDSTFASISTSEKVNIGHGRLTRLSPITGYTMRRPVQWADLIRGYQHDLKTTTWWKALGSLQGWGIEDEHDERVDGGALNGRFTCARTWGNGPEGAFIAKSVTRAADGSILSMDHNVAVVNLARTVVQRTTEMFAGQTLVLKSPDTLGRRFATAASLKDLEAKVNRELQTNLLSNIGGEGQRASAAKWTAATDDDFGIADATLNGTLSLELNGTIVTIATNVEVK